MRERLDEIPVYEHRQGSVSAEHFNIVTIALKRLERPIRLELPKLRTLDLLLDDDAWIVVDRNLNDVPVMAWLDFDTRHRAGLHAPVSCTLNFYHIHAPIIIGKVMEAMDLLLGERLTQKFPEIGEKVIPFPGAEKTKED